jgi:DnaJ-class molecular chaperone
MAREEDIKHAYRARSLLLHPDKNPSPLAQEAFLLLSQAYEALKHSPVPLVNLRASSDDFSMNRMTPSYQRYNQTCEALLKQYFAPAQPTPAVPVNARKRKDISPPNSPTLGHSFNFTTRGSSDSMVVDNDSQSYDDECTCGNERCTCGESDLKRPRASSPSAFESGGLPGFQHLEQASFMSQSAPTTQTHCAGLFTSFWNKFASFMECPHSKAANSTSSTPDNLVQQLPPDAVPAAKPVCHGASLFSFLSSETYATKLYSMGFSAPCSKKKARSKKE